MIIKNLLTANKELYEDDFKSYIEVKISSIFSHLIQVEGKKQILEINEKFKDNPNEINYASIVNLHLNEIEEKNVNFITPTQIKKLKIIRDIYVENLDSSRVNNARTKLTKVFSKNLVCEIENTLFNRQSLADETREFLENMLSSSKEPTITSKPKI